MLKRRTARAASPWLVSDWAWPRRTDAEFRPQDALNEGAGHAATQPGRRRPGPKAVEVGIQKLALRKKKAKKEKKRNTKITAINIES